MSRVVRLDDTVPPAVDTLPPAERQHFDQLVEALEREGIDGLPPSAVRRLPDEARGEKDGPVWLVRVSKRYRAFVTDRGDHLRILHVAPKKRLEKWGSARTRN
jgi:hypothetical protein